MPCGTFVLKEDNDRPIVLISAGIGLTPMVSMLDYVLSREVILMSHFQGEGSSFFWSFI